MLWGVAAVLAALISARIAYGVYKRKLRAAVRPASVLLLIQTVWTATALVFINVIYNALVMSPVVQ